MIPLLLELCEKYGSMSEEGISLNIRLSHQEMASIIGSTRETVTVVLGQLQKEGLLKIARRRVLISDLTRLAAAVNEAPPILKSMTPHPTLMPRLSSAQ